jgi:hypothetical protein
VLRVRLQQRHAIVPSAPALPLELLVYEPLDHGFPSGFGGSLGFGFGPRLSRCDLGSSGFLGVLPGLGQPLALVDLGKGDHFELRRPAALLVTQGAEAVDASELEPAIAGLVVLEAGHDLPDQAVAEGDGCLVLFLSSHN